MRSGDTQCITCMHYACMQPSNDRNRCTTGQVITDPATGRSKGYGFVRFANENERDRALEMQGFSLSGRPIRVSLATARRSGAANGVGGMGAGPYGGGASAVPHPAELDPTNTTLFIGGLSAGVSEEQLRAIFGQYGDIVYTKIPAGKGAGLGAWSGALWRMHACMHLKALGCGYFFAGCA